MDKTVEQIASLLNSVLFIESPRISENMRNNIKIASIDEDKIVIEIAGKFYDPKEYAKNKKIVYTGANYGGITNYAMWVNQLGGYATGNESMHWVNRACNEVVDAICNKIGAEKVNELEL